MPEQINRRSHLRLVAVNGEIIDSTTQETPFLTVEAAALADYLHSGYLLVNYDFTLLDNGWADVAWNEQIVKQAFIELLEHTDEAWVCITVGERNMYFDTTHQEAYAKAGQILDTWYEELSTPARASEPDYIGMFGRRIPNELTRAVNGFSDNLRHAAHRVLSIVHE